MQVASTVLLTLRQSLLIRRLWGAETRLQLGAPVVVSIRRFRWAIFGLANDPLAGTRLYGAAWIG